MFRHEIIQSDVARHICKSTRNRGSYISDHVLLNLINELGKR